MKVTLTELRHILRHSRWFLPELVLQCRREYNKRMRAKSLITIELEINLKKSEKKLK